MAITYDVCIRGGGIVGRTLALLLARDRLRVALAGQPGAAEASGHSDIRAYALNAASRALLDGLRAWPDAAHATPLAGMEVHGDGGGLLRFSAAEQKAEALAWIVDVPALESRLADAVRFQPQIELVDAPVQAALTVVCEGRASATRAEFGADFDVTPYGQHAIAARLDCAQPHGGVARQWFLAQGDILALLPLGGPAGSRVALVWSVAEDRADALLALDDAAFTATLESACGQTLGTMTLAGPRARWPLQLARARRWSGSLPGSAATGAGVRSWALAGDAAHNVHPLSGQGLNLGLGDVAELARVLQGRDYWRSVGDPRLLRRYARARQADVQALGSVTDGLQRLFAHDGGPWPVLRNWGLQGFDRSGPLKHWVTRRAMGLG